MGVEISVKNQPGFLSLSNDSFDGLMSLVDYPIDPQRVGSIKDKNLDLLYMGAFKALNQPKLREPFCYETAVNQSPGHATFICFGRSDEYWVGKLTKLLSLIKTARKFDSYLIFY